MPVTVILRRFKSIHWTSDIALDLQMLKEIVYVRAGGGGQLVTSFAVACEELSLSPSAKGVATPSGYVNSKTLQCECLARARAAPARPRRPRRCRSVAAAARRCTETRRAGGSEVAFLPPPPSTRLRPPHATL
ncbi:unnamed protein product [Leptosia nina]|uniref:Uncharacterized protein n=1 Tax=Leptosia nina TaxID=320188 RepID=A0AAV1IVY7_9NEOP